MQKEWKWIIATFIVTFVVTGLPFSFDFFSQIDLHFHDTLIVARPLYLSVGVWVSFAFIIFGIRAAANRFSDIDGVKVLAVVNVCFIFCTLYVSLVFYRLISSLLDFDLNPELIHRLQSVTLITIGSVIFLFSIVEFFLIKRIKSLK